MTTAKETLSAALYTALSRLRQYGRVGIGRITGTCPSTNGQAVMSLEEARLFHRVELSAVASLLIQKGVFTSEEFTVQMIEEARHLDAGLAKDWPEITVAEDGRSFSIDTAKMFQRTKHEAWPP